jgi:hypothetical protein
MKISEFDAAPGHRVHDLSPAAIESTRKETIVLLTGSPIGPPGGRDYDGLTVRLTLRHAGDMLKLDVTFQNPTEQVVADVEFRPSALHFFHRPKVVGRFSFERSTKLRAGQSHRLTDR